MAWTTPRTWVAAEVPTETTFNTHVRDNLNALYGTLTSYTPQVDQGGTTNIAKTVTYASYIRQGQTVTVWVALAMTASGTATNNVTVTLPVTAAATVGIVGSGYFYDSSTTLLDTVAVELSTTTRIVMARTNTGGAYIGNSPNVALASGDLIRFCATYPV